MTTRKWQNQEGKDQYSTEIVLQGFGAKLVMLDGNQQLDPAGQAPAKPSNSGQGSGYIDGDEITF